MTRRSRPLRSWRVRFTIVAALASAGGAVAASGAGCGVESSLVGGACATGYTDCNNVCIPTTSDPDNCGACGIVCPSKQCVNSVCVGTGDARAEASTDAQTDAKRDGGVYDGSHDGAKDGSEDAAEDVHLRDGAGSDAVHADGSSTDGPLTDGHPTDGHTEDGHGADAHLQDSAPADGSGVDHCAPPYVTTQSCGACGQACAATQVCSPTNGNDSGADAGPYACEAACMLPFVACDGTCLAVGNDPDNCGMCGNVCLSGICVQGECAGSTPGDIVVIGHDYASSPVHVSEAELLSNAVFLPAANPVRVLSYEQYAAPTQVANVKQVLAQEAMTFGRTVHLTTVTDSTLVAADLASADYDVLLVYDQTSAPQSSLAPIGTAWAMQLNQFLLGGGDVVVLDGAQGAFPQMASFLSAASLLQTTGEVPIPSGSQLLVVASGDTVGNSVVSPYAAQSYTVSFQTSEANGGSVTYVVDDLAGGNLVPVVIHKTVMAP